MTCAGSVRVCVCVCSLVRDDLLTGDFSANMKLVQVVTYCCVFISRDVDEEYETPAWHVTLNYKC